MRMNIGAVSPVKLLLNVLVSTQSIYGQW